MRVLFMAYHFPPLGGAGVQRAIKLVKYLPDCRVDPIVITGPGADGAWWTPRDDSMLREVPHGLRVYRLRNGMGSERTAEMLELGEKLIREFGIRVILLSMDPFDDATVAAELSRRTGIPWIADLRDPWALDEFRMYRSTLHRAVDRLRMVRVLSTAALTIANTPEAARRIKALRGMRQRRVIAITNGYDIEDFSGPCDGPEPGRFTIVHSGYLHTEEGLRQKRRRWAYSLLGRTARGVEVLPRSHYYLLRALERWREDKPAIVDTVRVRFVGRMSDSDMAEVHSSRVQPMCEIWGYRPHSEAVREVRAAHLLFLPMHKIQRGQRSTIVPGKVYEYMASGRPILAAVPAGDARDYLVAYGADVCEPTSIAEMGRILRRRYTLWTRKEPWRGGNRRFVEQFERRRIAKELASAIRDVGGARRWSSE
jgi:glycosyltransferase involved in cell wall biosynthesis